MLDAHESHILNGRFSFKFGGKGLQHCGNFTADFDVIRTHETGDLDFEPIPILNSVTVGAFKNKQEEFFQIPENWGKYHVQVRLYDSQAATYELPISKNSMSISHVPTCVMDIEQFTYVDIFTNAEGDHFEHTFDYDVTKNKWCTEIEGTIYLSSASFEKPSDLEYAWSCTETHYDSSEEDDSHYYNSLAQIG